MYKHTCKVRVRYCETDQMGFTHHSTYIIYFEHARSELLRDLGHPYAEMEKNGIISPIMSLQIRYVRPTQYDDEITLHTEIRELPENYAVFHHELRNAQGKLVCGGMVKLGFLEAATKKRRPVPGELLASLRKEFEVD